MNMFNHLPPFKWYVLQNFPFIEADFDAITNYQLLCKIVEYLNLNNIMLQVYSFNKRAIKSYKKAGFKEFGRRHNVITIKNKLYDEIYMEILKEDYFK